MVKHIKLNGQFGTAGIIEKTLLVHEIKDAKAAILLGKSFLFV
jgi:hypothetical protein